MTSKSHNDSASTKHHHPYVSEQDEGKTWYEWALCAIIVACAIIMAFGHVGISTAIISGVPIFSGVLRIVLRGKSPWKVRGVFFDSFISICLGLGLIVLYMSILAL